jgi:hypothetical protein
VKKLLVDGFTTKIACPTGSFRVLVYPVRLTNPILLRGLRVLVDQSVEDRVTLDRGGGPVGDLRAWCGWSLAERAGPGVPGHDYWHADGTLDRGWQRECA